jgi:uncharacterized protein (TIGR03435 family)
VTSVKRNNDGGPMRMLNAPGNFNATNVPVTQLIRMAYQVQDFQIVGAPSWANSDRFDIQGKFDPASMTPPAPGQTPPMLVMLRTLLRERFGMAAHTETREMPVLALKLARDDGRLGPQLKQAAVDCAALGRGGPGGRPGGPPVDGRGGPPDGRVGGPEPGRGLPPLPPPGAPFSLGERPQCGGRGGPGILMAGGMPMTQFASQLMQLTGRVVVDRTGLKGGYDLDLKWTPTPDQIQLAPGPPPPGVELPQFDPNGPSLFTALQEQLGLKLDGERGPVEVVVIDALTPPKEN